MPILFRYLKQSARSSPQRSRVHYALDDTLLNPVSQGQTRETHDAHGHPVERGLRALTSMAIQTSKAPAL